jgi:hypothetical protein
VIGDRCLIRKKGARPMVSRMAAFLPPLAENPEGIAELKRDPDVLMRDSGLSDVDAAAREAATALRRS